MGVLAWIGEKAVPTHRELAPSLSHVPIRHLLHLAHAGYCTHIFLSKVNEVLEVNVIPVGLDIVVDEEVELVSNPVLEDKG